jgi:hypothetical protein
VIHDAPIDRADIFECAVFDRIDKFSASEGLVSADFFKAAARCCQSAWVSFAASFKFNAVLHRNLFCTKNYLPTKSTLSYFVRLSESISRSALWAWL